MRSDSVFSHTAVLWRGLEGGRFAGTISAFVLRTGVEAAGPPPGLTIPLSFSGDASSPERVADCARAVAAAAVSSTRDAWYRLPDTLRIGSTWSDTLSAPACRDGISLRLQAYRNYRVQAVEAASDGFVLVVFREHRLEIEGRGDQWGEPVRAEGHGSGTMTLRILAATGALLSADGQATLALSLQGSRRTERVQQSSRTLIRPDTSK